MIRKFNIKRDILIFTLIIAISSKIIVLRNIHVVNQTQIGIINRFKSNNVLISKQTRQRAAKIDSFQGMDQIPTIKIEFQGYKSKKWMPINENLSVYELKVMIHEDQLQEFLTSRSEKEEDTIYLLNKRFQDQVRKWNHQKILCFHDQRELKDQTFRDFLSECIKNLKFQLKKEEQTLLLDASQNYDLTISGIIILLMSVLTSAKLSYSFIMTKQDSVV